MRNVKYRVKETEIKKKILFAVVLILFAALQAVYYDAVLLDPGLGSKMSLLITAAAGLVFLTAAIITGTGQKIGLLFYAQTAACLSWVAGGIIRMLNPGGEMSPTVFFMHVLPLVIIGVSTLAITLRQNNKWRQVKSILEAATAGLMTVLFIWFVLITREDAAVIGLSNDALISLILIIVDAYIPVQLVLLLLSADKKKLPACFIMIGAGFFIYGATDLTGWIFGCFGYDSFAAVLGGFYVLSFYVGALGALLYALFNRAVQPVYRDIRNHFLYLLLFPAAAVFLKGFSLIPLFIFGVVIGLYAISAKYISQAENNEKLLKKERDGRALLEKRIEQQHSELATLHDCDTVTQLYNRVYLTTCLEKALRQRRNNEIIAVLQLDIDRFKTINDNYGHAFGDKIIIEIADRLRAWNSCGAVLSRLGGDEFAVLLHGSYSRYELGVFCKQIMGACSEPIHIDAQLLYITVSIGVSLCPNDAVDGVTLLKNADISMYKAKAEGCGKYVFYNAVFKENIRRKIEIESLLRKAELERDFELAFQPQFDLPDHRLIGAEALIRWKNDNLGYIPPNIFVPVAEEINYIGQLGAWVLMKAIQQIMYWNTRYELNLKVGVNISPKQLSEKHFFTTLKSLITDSGVNTAWLDAEITENLMIEEKTKVSPIFELFRELKISVSIDDFGSGYSSLGYLNKFHFDRIKIDKSLIDNLLVPDGSGIEVVKAIINMANAVGKVTIAEGVEKLEQLKILEELGCRQIQGYLLGRPVSAQEFTQRYIKSGVAVSQTDLFNN